MKNYERFPLYIYNSISRKKEKFVPIHEPHVGMYVCGPTVYNDVHIGNCRTFVSFDIMFRYMKYLDYKVRYVRNITDVGHLMDDTGEDKLVQRARIEKLEPMEIAHKYTHRFRDIMSLLNTLPPSIEPIASGHIPEQIEMVQKIIDNGYGYVVNGSVYFDTKKFARDTDQYGKLSGRVLEDLIAESRELKSQDEKRDPADFAIWMKAEEGHIMRWNSPWSEGFPGWHLECSAMSTKYLGEKFDIHGGGSDLKFPHHENEIAQNYGACHTAPANYWIHTNMLLMNGRKMAKSDGNTITPDQLMNGNSEHISQAYHPMSIRFFFLQAHYSSTLDLTDDALIAADRGFRRLMNSMQIIENISEKEFSGSADSPLSPQLKKLADQCFHEMSDDFNTAKTLAVLFEMSRKNNEIDQVKISKKDLDPKVFLNFKNTYIDFIQNVLGLQPIREEGGKIDDVIQILLEMRGEARDERNFELADKIRDQLLEAGITIKDGKDGTTYQI